MLELAESKVYQFDEFRLDGKNRRLFRRESNELVPLTPKALELLIVLVQNYGRIVSKDELLETIWGDSIVEESNLSQTIFVLRKALGENTKEPRFILTVPNRGYQFIALVREIGGTEDKILEEEFLTDAQNTAVDRTKTLDRKPQTAKPAWLLVPFVLLVLFGGYWFYPTAKSVTVREVKSIAVLPFEDLSAEQTEKYLGVSLADALANKFSGLKQITVRPTRAVLKYVESGEDSQKIGRALQVDAVLDGRIQRDGDRVRVSVQLVRTSDNTTIWSKNFDDDFTNFFAVQDSISRQVVQSLALQMDEAEREKFNRRGTENALAYEEYLRGRYFWNKRSADNLQKAIENFNRAVTLDPNFAQAHAALAETYVIYNFYATTIDREAFPKARVAATRALEIDNQLAEAHAALGLVKSQYDFDWDGAEKLYLRAIELNPNYPTARQWYGEFLAFRNRTDESLTQMNRAIQLDPTSLSTNTAPALPYLISGQFEKALEVTDKVLEMDAGFAIALHYKARALFRMGRHEESFEIYRKAASNGSAFFKADLGSFYARAGHDAEARKILAELSETAKVQHVSPYHFAILHNALNDRETAFDYLRKAVAEHDAFVITLPVSANFENLRDDPRFIEILQRANLSDNNKQ
ncbi:MAG: winged helix-turn-helix domain-containing protein [Pyrinomonadaceae bacterium]